MFNLKVSHRHGSHAPASPMSKGAEKAKGPQTSGGNPGLPGRASPSNAAAASSSPPRRGLDHLLGQKAGAPHGRGLGSWFKTGGKAKTEGSSQSAEGHQQINQGFAFKLQRSDEEIFESRLQHLLAEHPNKMLSVELGSHFYNGQIDQFRARVTYEMNATYEPTEQRMFKGLLSALGKMVGETPQAQEPAHRPAETRPAQPMGQVAPGNLEMPQHKFNDSLRELVSKYPNAQVANQLAWLLNSGDYEGFGNKLDAELRVAPNWTAGKLLSEVKSSLEQMDGDFTGVRVVPPRR